MGVVMTRRTGSPLRITLVMGVVLAVLGGLLAVTGTPAVAAATGRVRGAIIQNDGTAPKVRLSWFRSDWTYLNARKVTGGAYSLALQPGTYYLQFTDLRPSYDVTKSAPTTVKVTVRTASTSVKNVRMRRGASIGGVVKAGGKVAAGARVVAANTDEQSFESTANKAGQYALGGLPPGNYSVFTYDKSGAYVGKSTYLRRLKGPAYKNVNIALTKRAGGLLVDLYAGNAIYPGAAFVTAVSRATGQFWTAKASHGSVTFRGLYPGSYDLQVPGVGNYLGAKVRVKAKVVSGRVKFGSARLTKRGGWLTGRVTGEHAEDTAHGAAGQHPLAGASVRLYAADGHELDSTTTNGSGAFTLDGQLTTQGGLAVVVGPGPDSAYLDNCTYRVARLGGKSVTTNRQTVLGNIALVLTDDAPTQCSPPPVPKAS